MNLYQIMILIMQSKKLNKFVNNREYRGDKLIFLSY